MKNKLLILISVITFLVLIIAIPLAMNRYILGSLILGNNLNSDWVNFLGAYIGTIIGSITSIIGIGMTIHFTNLTNKTDHELQVRPYCSIQFCHDSFPKDMRGNSLAQEEKIPNTLGKIFISNTPGLSMKSITNRYLLQLTNMGLGPATEMSFNVVNINIDTLGKQCIASNQLIISNRESKVSNSLKCDETNTLQLSLMLYYDTIAMSKQEITSTVTEKEIHAVSKRQYEVEFGEIGIKIEVKYKDILENTYIQYVRLKGKINAKLEAVDENRFIPTQFDFSIRLEEVGPPQKSTKQ